MKLAADAVERLYKASGAIAPWVSASLEELQPGHTGEYERDANEFLAAVEDFRAMFPGAIP